MTSELTCGCCLCRIERQLTEEIASGADAYRVLFSSASNGLQAFTSPASLLFHLRAGHVDAHSDELLRGLLTARPVTSQFVESLFVLAFLPMLHATIRRVVRRQPTLSDDDVTQQALSLFLQFLRSEELQKRQSHFAFTISRAVKRQMFEWANREVGLSMPQSREIAEVLADLNVEESMERHALLQHFLHGCFTKGLLTDTELDLLIQFKLDGNAADEVGDAHSISPNAVRQKMKRVLAKLRRLARHQLQNSAGGNSEMRDTALARFSQRLRHVFLSKR